MDTLLNNILTIWNFLDRWGGRSQVYIFSLQWLIHRKVRSWRLLKFYSLWQHWGGPWFKSTIQIWFVTKCRLKFSLDVLHFELLLQGFHKFALKKRTTETTAIIRHILTETYWYPHSTTCYYWTLKAVTQPQIFCWYTIRLHRQGEYTCASASLQCFYCISI